MAKLTEQGFIDDGTDDLLIVGTLTVMGGSTIENAVITYNSTQKTSNYTISASDYMVECTSGTFNITLPSATTHPGKEYAIKNSGTGVITILTTDSQLIDDNVSGEIGL